MFGFLGQKHASRCDRVRTCKVHDRVLSRKRPCRRDSRHYAIQFLHYGQCDFTQLRRVIEILVDIKLSAPMPNVEGRLEVSTSDRCAGFRFSSYTTSFQANRQGMRFIATEFIWRG
jgi:hypothetical protein